jgi:hypothetical protein
MDAGARMCACTRVALLMQHAMRMRHIVIFGPSGSAYFLTMPRNGHDCRKNFIKHKMCVLISLQLLFEKYLILRSTQRDIVINVRSLYVNTRYFCRILTKLEFPLQVFGKKKKAQI